MADKSIFEKLNAINVNGHTEDRKGSGKNLTYLSWTWAWSEFKKACPDANYEIVKFDGLPYCYDPNTGYMVYTKVTVEGITHEMWLPVMDGANKAMKAQSYKYQAKNPNFKYAKKNKGDGKYYDSFGKEQTEFVTKTCEAATMFDINKTIMRCLTKNLAMFGLGLYIYAGEDLPEEEKEAQKAQKEVDEQARQVAIDTLKKTGSKAQVEYFERQIGTSVDNFTYEQADGAVKRIIAKQKEKEGEK